MNMRSYWMRVGANPMTGILRRREKLVHRYTGTQREHRVKMERDAREMGAQAKEHQRLGTTSRSWESSKEQFRPLSPRRNQPCRHPDFKLLASRSVGIDLCCLQLPSLWYCVPVALRNQHSSVREHSMTQRGTWQWWPGEIPIRPKIPSTWDCA